MANWISPSDFSEKMKMSWKMTSRISFTEKFRFEKSQIIFLRGSFPEKNEKTVSKCDEKNFLCWAIFWENEKLVSKNDEKTFFFRAIVWEDEKTVFKNGKLFYHGQIFQKRMKKKTCFEKWRKKFHFLGNFYTENRKSFWKMAKYFPPSKFFGKEWKKLYQKTTKKKPLRANFRKKRK